MPSALVLGSANCLYADVQLATTHWQPDIVAACNNTGITWEGHVDIWCTLHPNQTTDWPGIVEGMRRRTVIHKRNKPATWAHKKEKGIDYSTDDWAGSTGLFAVKVLRFEYGCDRIVLAGVPMSEEGAHYYTKEKWKQAKRYHRAWHKHLVEIAPYVRSMSGHTREWLGAPDTSWLANRGEARDAQVAHRR